MLIAGEWEEQPGYEPDWRAVEPDDLLTLIYTSGTTGPPKGVQITHRNMMAAVDAVEQRVKFPEGSRVISWLPSAHVAERTAHHYLPIVFAMTRHVLPGPAPDRRVAAEGQADVVLRRPTRVGEAEGRDRGQARG